MGFDPTVTTYVIFYILLIGPAYVLFRLTVYIINLFSSNIYLSSINVSKMKDIDKVLVSSFFVFVILTLQYSLFKQDTLEKILSNTLTTEILKSYLLTYILIFLLIVAIIFFSLVIANILQMIINNILYTTLFFSKKENLKERYEEMRSESIGAAIWTLLANVTDCKKKKILFTFFLKDSNVICGFIDNYKRPPHFEIKLSDAQIKHNGKISKVGTIWIPYEHIKYYSMTKKYRKEILKYPTSFWFSSCAFFVIASFIFILAGIYRKTLIISALLAVICSYLAYKKKGAEITIQ